MKQYTTPEQTAKLIELGLEKPRISAGVIKWKGYEPIYTGSYTLGELIEMLPTSVKIKGYDCFLYIGPNVHDGSWNVGYMRYNVELNQRATELIDAVYDLVIILKEEGVI